MDYHSLPRKQLQVLCKKHGIPANSTNVEMADALSALLKKSLQVPQESSKIQGKRVTRRTREEDSSAKSQAIEPATVYEERALKGKFSRNNLEKDSENKAAGNGSIFCRRTTKHGAEISHKLPENVNQSIVTEKTDKNATHEKPPSSEMNMSTSSEGQTVPKPKSSGIVLRGRKIKVRSPGNSSQSPKSRKKETETTAQEEGEISSHNRAQHGLLRKKGTVTFSDVIEVKVTEAEPNTEEGVPQFDVFSPAGNRKTRSSRRGNISSDRNVVVQEPGKSTRRGLRHPSMAAQSVEEKGTNTRGGLRKAVYQVKEEDAVIGKHKELPAALLGDARRLPSSKRGGANATEDPEKPAVPSASGVKCTGEDKKLVDITSSVNPRRSRRLTLAASEIQLTESAALDTKESEAALDIKESEASLKDSHGAESFLGMNEVEGIASTANVRRSRRLTLAASEIKPIQTHTVAADNQVEISSSNVLLSEQENQNISKDTGKATKENIRCTRRKLKAFQEEHQTITLTIDSANTDLGVSNGCKERESKEAVNKLETGARCAKNPSSSSMTCGTKGEVTLKPTMERPKRNKKSYMEPLKQQIRSHENAKLSSRIVSTKASAKQKFKDAANTDLPLDKETEVVPSHSSEMIDKDEKKIICAASNEHPEIENQSSLVSALSSFEVQESGFLDSYTTSCMSEVVQALDVTELGQTCADEQIFELPAVQTLPSDVMLAENQAEILHDNGGAGAMCNSLESEVHSIDNGECFLGAVDPEDDLVIYLDHSAMNQQASTQESLSMMHPEDDPVPYLDHSASNQQTSAQDSLSTTHVRRERSPTMPSNESIAAKDGSDSSENFQKNSLEHTAYEVSMLQQHRVKQSWDAPVENPELGWTTDEPENGLYLLQQGGEGTGKVEIHEESSFEEEEIQRSKGNVLIEEYKSCVSEVAVDASVTAVLELRHSSRDKNEELPETSLEKAAEVHESVIEDTARTDEPEEAFESEEYYSDTNDFSSLMEEQERYSEKEEESSEVEEVCPFNGGENCCDGSETEEGDENKSSSEWEDDDCSSEWEASFAPDTEQQVPVAPSSHNRQCENTVLGEDLAENSSTTPISKAKEGLFDMRDSMEAVIHQLLDKYCNHFVPNEELPEKGNYNTFINQEGNSTVDTNYVASLASSECQFPFQVLANSILDQTTTDCLETNDEHGTEGEEGFAVLVAGDKPVSHSMECDKTVLCEDLGGNGSTFLIQKAQEDIVDKADNMDGEVTHQVADEELAEYGNIFLLVKVEEGIVDKTGKMDGEATHQVADEELAVNGNIKAEEDILVSINCMEASAVSQCSSPSTALGGHVYDHTITELVETNKEDIGDAEISSVVFDAAHKLGSQNGQFGDSVLGEELAENGSAIPFSTVDEGLLGKIGSKDTNCYHQMLEDHCDYELPNEDQAENVNTITLYKAEKDTRVNKESLASPQCHSPSTLLAISFHGQTSTNLLETNEEGKAETETSFAVFGKADKSDSLCLQVDFESENYDFTNLERRQKETISPVTCFPEMAGSVEHYHPDAERLKEFEQEDMGIEKVEVSRIGKDAEEGTEIVINVQVDQGPLISCSRVEESNTKDFEGHCLISTPLGQASHTPKGSSFTKVCNPEDCISESIEVFNRVREEQIRCRFEDCIPESIEVFNLVDGEQFKQEMKTGASVKELTDAKSLHMFKQEAELADEQHRHVISKTTENSSIAPEQVPCAKTELVEDRGPVFIKAEVSCPLMPINGDDLGGGQKGFYGVVVGDDDGVDMCQHADLDTKAGMHDQGGNQISNETNELRSETHKETKLLDESIVDDVNLGSIELVDDSYTGKCKHVDLGDLTDWEENGLGKCEPVQCLDEGHERSLASVEEPNPRDVEEHIVVLQMEDLEELAIEPFVQSFKSAISLCKGGGNEKEAYEDNQLVADALQPHSYLQDSETEVEESLMSSDKKGNTISNEEISAHEMHEHNQAAGLQEVSEVLLANLEQQDDEESEDSQQLTISSSGQSAEPTDTYKSSVVSEVWYHEIPPEKFYSRATMGTKPFQEAGCLKCSTPEVNFNSQEEDALVKTTPNDVIPNGKVFEELQKHAIAPESHSIDTTDDAHECSVEIGACTEIPVERFYNRSMVGITEHLKEKGGLKREIPQVNCEETELSPKGIEIKTSNVVAVTEDDYVYDGKEAIEAENMGSSSKFFGSVEAMQINGEDSCVYNDDHAVQAENVDLSLKGVSKVASKEKESNDSTKELKNPGCTELESSSALLKRDKSMENHNPICKENQVSARKNPSNISAAYPPRALASASKRSALKALSSNVTQTSSVGGQTPTTKFQHTPRPRNLLSAYEGKEGSSSSSSPQAPRSLKREFGRSHLR